MLQNFVNFTFDVVMVQILAKWYFVGDVNEGRTGHLTTIIGE